MRMPGQGWLAWAGMFLGMWAVMMVAMMMPVFAREALRFNREAARRGPVTLAYAGGYFGAWIAAGIAMFPLGVAFAVLAMRSEAVSRAAPVMAGLVVMLAGASQFTRWKARRLAECRHAAACARTRPSNYHAALREGSRLGLRCICCCAPLPAVLFVVGVMDLLAMALITIAISAERLMAAGVAVARLTGAALLVGGAMMLHAL